MNTIIRVIGKIFDKANILFCRYKSLEMNLLIGGGNRNITYPYVVSGAQNIIAGEPISIGPNCTILKFRK